MKKLFLLKVRLLNFVLFLAFTTSATVAQTDFWEQTSGPAGQSVDALVINSGDQIFAGTSGFAGTAAGVFRSIDNGDNWQAINAGLTDTDIRALAFNAIGDILAGTSGGGVFRSTDNGDTWTATSLTDTWVSGLAINSNGELFASSGFLGIFRSIDNGDNWVEINNGLTDKQLNVIAINSNGDIFAAGARLFRSTDNGDTWQEKINGFTNNGGIFSIAFSPSGDIFLGTFVGIFRSTDVGDNWVQVSSDVSDVNALAITSEGVIFAGRQGLGAFRSQDNGDTWLEINQGLTGFFVFDFAINSSGIIFAGTNQGVFRSVESVTYVGKNGREVPSSFALEQNYPNPFNPSTNISYSIPTSGFVTLIVYDVLGRETQTIVHQLQQAGTHSIIFESGLLATGLYFYKLEVGGKFIATKKMLIVR